MRWEGIKESQTSGVLLVIVNNSVFWKIPRFTFIVHKLCAVMSVNMLSYGKIHKSHHPHLSSLRNKKLVAKFLYFYKNVIIFI